MRIQPNFSSWTLRKKLISIIMMGSTVCLLVSLLVMVGSSVNSRNKESLQELVGLADVLAENGHAALLFSDRVEAKRLLESLGSHPAISSAWLVTADKTLLSSWSRSGMTEAVPFDYKVESRQLRSDFWLSRADLYMPVTIGKEKIGYVLLKADFTERWKSYLADLEKGLGGAALALLVVFVLSARLQRVISQPIEELADTARAIANNKTYELRVSQRTNDEIGGLVLAFNKMLEEIQKRDENLTTQRDHLEETVNMRTAELRTILENTPDTIARYDRNCRRIYANQAFGVLAKDGIPALMGKTPSEYPGGSNAEIYEAKLKEVFATGENTYFNLIWKSDFGKDICSYIQLTAERDSSGSVISVLAVGRDISELNEYQAELQRKELAKTSFLAAASHDMRQPLAAANLFISALKFTELNVYQDQLVQRLELAMSNFNSLLDALLNVSKLDAGIIKPEYTSINVTELLIWLEQNLEPLASEKGIKLKFYFSVKESFAVRSDLRLIQSVLMNLVSNAVKFTSKGGVLVSARRRGSDVLFQVWDTGLGIKSEHLDRVFDEFYQINNPQGDRTRGLGLGLSIVKRALSLLGQKITCRSQYERGSVFEFRLPLDVESNQMQRKDVAAALQEDFDLAAFVRNKRFVVVEDDALVAEALGKALQGMGGEVKLYENAEAALSHATEDADFYIVDFMLSGSLNGMQFLNLLCQKRGKRVKAVMMTGDTSPAFVREAENCAWPVHHKPVSLSKLIWSFRTQVE
jgi:PAS domain S-box-containing protein